MTTDAEISRRIAELNARSKTSIISQHRVKTSPRCSELVTDYVTANGDFNQGYTASYNQTRTEKECHDINPCDKRGSNCVLWDEPVSSHIAIAGATSIPVFSPSGNAFVDTFNQERIAIYEVMFILNQQKLLAKSMEEMKSSLLSA